MLTGKQNEELQRAILSYLVSQKLTQASESFAQETSLSLTDLDNKYDGLLEKKWMSVVRLQKKVMDLEAKVSEMETETRHPIKLGEKKDLTSWIPRPPARHDLNGHRMPITAVIFHPIFSVCVTASEDAAIKVWDYESGEFERTLKGHTNAVQDLAFDQNGTMLASCAADFSIKLWTFETFECTKTMHGHDHNVTSVTFTPDSMLVVSASRDKTIKVWEVSTGYCVRTLQGHSDWVRKARLSLDGTLIASTCNDQSVRVWNFQSGETKFDLRGHDHVVEYVAWAPAAALMSINILIAGEMPSESAMLKGPFFATASRDKTIKIWDASTGQCVHTFVGHDNWVRWLVWHPGGKYLISSADDKTIRTWDLAHKRCHKTLEAHSHFVSCIDMHPTAPFLVSGSVDQSVKVWDCR
eukprot:m.174612 g.174612  ORF g.174612 m.174612 type:complete len:411 (+) comp17330_c3_seq1:124-1356(+)